MGILARPAQIQVVEPCPAPLIPVSGIASLTSLAGDMVCVTYYHEVPAMDGTVERHICARVVWPRALIVPGIYGLWMALRVGGYSIAPDNGLSLH